MSFTDITITCQDCGQDFAWTAGEQEFYQKKDLDQPKYCLICRGKYKAMKKDAQSFGRQTIIDRD